ncbi:MAG: SDR family oxidoreductase [Gemmatimonadetes bacterium]|nr:SDR family oxidoreductase [Gemmatimonadota bacterium]
MHVSSAVDRAPALRARSTHVLVTGATGYIGGRLVPRLLAKGYAVRCVARDPSRLEGRSWSGVEIVAGDLSDAEATRHALAGIDTAYYLVHSMAAGEAFRERDQAMALAFGQAAAAAGVRRIIYLGGLGDPKEVHSKHLISRQEVGRSLAAAGVPVTEFRAAVIVGSGSASFEIIRHLIERLPLMIAPIWVRTRCQPIGVRSVIEYLMEALDHPTANGIYEIGGEDILTYREMMMRYARIRGLRRFIVSFPVPRPEFSGRWVDVFTPIPFSIAQPLVESLQTEVVVRDNRARTTFHVRPTGYDDAVRLALTRLAQDSVETTWASSLSSMSRDFDEADVLGSHEGMLLDRHRRRVKASPERVFEAICSLGGEEGWPAGNALWQLRGLMDRVVGGVGMRRGRRHPRELRVGDPLDFWRVEALDVPHLLRLRAEMKLPGRAWLQFEVVADRAGSWVEQTAFFDPDGILGYLYWYSVLPFHRFVFPGLIGSLKQQAESED